MIARAGYHPGVPPEAVDPPPGASIISVRAVVYVQVQSRSACTSTEVSAAGTCGLGLVLLFVGHSVPPTDSLTMSKHG
jgi:hypothetical protein